MRLFRRSLALFLSLLMLFALAACEVQPEQTETSHPSQPDDGRHVEPEALDAYEKAYAIYEAADSYSMSIVVTTEKQVGIWPTTETETITAKYAGMNTNTPTARITTIHALKDIHDAFNATEYHANGSTLYLISGEDYSYRAEENFDQFTQRHIPCRLFDPQRYDTIMTDREEKDRILFLEANAPEEWVPYVTEEYASISFEAEGWLQMANGVAKELEYTASFRQGAATYVMTCHISLEEEEINQDSLKVTAKGEQIAVTDLSLPRALRYASMHLDHVAVGRTGVSDHLQNGDGETRDEELIVNTCPDGNDSPAMFCSHYYNRSTFDIPAINYYAYIGDQGFSIDESGEISPSFGSIFRQYLEHNHAAEIPVPQYGEFATLNVKDLGDFLLLEGDLITPYAGAGMAALKDNFDLPLDILQEATVKTVKCRLSLDKDTGFLSAMHYTMEATLNHWFHKGDVSMERYLYTEAGDLSAYHALFGELVPDENLSEADKPNPLFYKVTDDNGNIAYLLGTIHIGDSLTSALPDKIYKALDAADALAVEMDLLGFEEKKEEDASLEQAYTDSYFFSAGTDLQSYLEDDDLYIRTNDLLFAMGYGAMANTMKPAAIASVIDSWHQESLNMVSSEQGVDMRLLTLAAEKGKKIYEIENVKEHLSAISDYSKETQIAMLKASLEAGRYETFLSTGYLYELWCEGDEELLRESVMPVLPEDATAEEKALYEEYMDKMMTQRDRIMVDGICGYLESGETVFVAVGLAHVVGEGGIVDQLKALGYTVTRVL